MSRLRLLLVAAVVGVMMIATVTTAQAAATTPVAVWEMNEAPGARVMADSSGNGITGTIGTEVITGHTVDDATGYRFTRLTPNTPPAHPEHIVTVPDNANLDPGTRDFAVTIRMRTTARFGNLIQKGQSGAKGGYFKFQNPNGIVQCLFRGSTGSIAVGSGRTLNDGGWHTIRCERTATRVTMTVDGVVVARRNGTTGSISNTWPLSIGGKVNCDQIEVTCDYFAGSIDRVQLDAG
jgi:Laminin G domain